MRQGDKYHLVPCWWKPCLYACTPMTEWAFAGNDFVHHCHKSPTFSLLFDSKENVLVSHDAIVTYWRPFVWIEYELQSLSTWHCFLVCNRLLLEYPSNNNHWHHWLELMSKSNMNKIDRLFLYNILIHWKTTALWETTWSVKWLMFQAPRLAPPPLPPFSSFSPSSSMRLKGSWHSK